jgi:hypothetical protein
MKKVILLGLLSIILPACSSDPTPTPAQPYEKGIFVINAGNFLDNNGTVSWMTREGKTATLDIFFKENNRNLTGGLRAYGENGNTGLLLLDHSTVGLDRIEVVTAGTFKSVASLTDVENPRRVVSASAQKSYITCWDATGDFSNFFKNPGYVAVLELGNTNRVSKKIKVGAGAESILVSGNEAIVGYTQGAGQNKITVLDIATDQVKQEIQVGSNPELIGFDAEGKLWVAAAGQLLQLNWATKAVEKRVDVSLPNFRQASSFVFSQDRRTIFFTASYFDSTDNFKQKGETYSLSISAIFLSTRPFLDRLFAGGLGIDPATGVLYAGLVPSFKQAGLVFRYQPNGTLIDSTKTEIAPSQFFFK